MQGDQMKTSSMKTLNTIRFTTGQTLSLAAFILSACAVKADVIITTLHSFQTAAGGVAPNALVLGNDGNLYGTTAGGGTAGHGTVFRFTTDGVLTTLCSFNGADTGSGPNAGLVQGSDGNFYGTTTRGGTYNYGTAFKVTPDGVLTSLHSFWRGDTDMGNNGYFPAAELIQGSDGNLYGMTEDGGQRGEGVVYKISTGGVFTNLHSFMHATTDGEYPLGAMVQGAGGDYCGTAQGGGPNYRGVVFKITANGAYTNLYSFTGGIDGANPNRLVLGADGNFYGTTGGGGTNNFGNVFKLTPDGVCTVLYSFSNGNDGRYPSQLVQGTDGNFYGTAGDGGTNIGTVFTITANGTFTSLHLFAGGNNGGGPNGVVLARDGHLYGTTQSGGLAGNGTIFKITPEGTFVSLYSFPGPINDGTSPRAGLVQGTDGSFYGSTYSGGASNYGTIFKIGADGTFTSLYSFTGSNTGTNPQVALVQGDDGSLYGTTPGGGTNNFGTVFKISTNGVFTSLYSFTGGRDSINPRAPLVKGNDGYLYGTTYGGQVSSTNTYGAVFKINANGDFTTLYSFTPGAGYTNSFNPRSGLLLGSDGIFYGTTYSGGSGNNPGGTVFSITADGLFSRLCSFTNGYLYNSGGYPTAGLVQGADGYLYGTTSGGIGWNGTVFRVSTAGVSTILHDDFYGDTPLTSLLQGADGNFYGTTYQRYSSLSSPRGRIFKITANGILTTVQTFYDNDGNGLSELIQGSDGSFYCTSQNGGAGYGAVLRITIGPVFKAASLSNGTLTLTWSTDVGSTYQLQYKSDLNSGNWLDLGSPVVATGSTLTATDSVANDPHRFYRVAVLPQ
jgi:uncharacterized repeat protein (TIGR03803 family)